MILVAAASYVSHSLLFPCARYAVQSIPHSWHPWSFVNAKRSLVFRSRATSSQWLKTVLSLVYNVYHFEWIRVISIIFCLWSLYIILALFCKLMLRCVLQVVKGKYGARIKKIRTSCRFRVKPTLKLPRKPMYPRKSMPRKTRYCRYNLVPNSI